MDQKTKITDYRLIGLAGSISLIISNFLPWFSGFTLLDLYLIMTYVAIEDSFLYLFPLMSGIICLIGCIMILYTEDFRINSVIINFIGLSFLLLFFFEIIQDVQLFISTIGIGFYFCVAGFLLVIIDIINILLENNKT